MPDIKGFIKDLGKAETWVSFGKSVLPSIGLTVGLSLLAGLFRGDRRSPRKKKFASLTSEGRSLNSGDTRPEQGTGSPVAGRSTKAGV